MVEEFGGENMDGWELLDREQFGEALKYFDVLLKKYPTSVYYNYGKAKTLTKLERYNDAIKYLDNIIKTFDKDLKEYWFTSADLFDITLKSLYDKAWLSGKTGKESDIPRCYEKAMSCIDALIELSTKEHYLDYPDRLLIFKAIVHATLEEYDQALDFLQRAITLYKSEGQEAFSEFKEDLLNPWLNEFGKLKDDPRFKALIE